MNFKVLVLEIGYNQKDKLTEFLKEQNINNFEFFKDLAGNIRGVEIILDENS